MGKVHGPVIEAAAARTSTVFILWGAEAQEKAGLIGGPSTSIITSAHPSPQSAHRGFFGSRPFSRANEALALAGLAEIDWALGKG